MEIFQEFKIILGYLKKYKKEVKITAIFALVGSVFTAIVPYFYGKLVDTAMIEPFSQDFVLALLGIWFLTTIISALFERITFLKRSCLGIDISNDLTCRASEHVVALPMKFHKDQKIGKIFSRIDRAAMYISRIVEDIVFLIFPQILTVVIGVSILFFVDWRLAVGAAMLFVGYILITIYKVSPIVETQDKINKAFERAYGNLYDSFVNIQAIKSCAAENFQKIKMRKDFKENLATVYKKLMRLWASLAFYQHLFFGIGFIIIFGFAILLLKQDMISSGKLIMFLGYLNLMHMPLKDLARRWKVFKTGMPAIKRVEKLLRAKQEDYKKQGKILDTLEGKVEFKDIAFGYKKSRLILSDINFIAESGQKIAIVGGSGEGKTTLVDLISLYFIPVKGKILLDGVDIKKLNLEFLRKIIAYVPQDIVLFNDTIRNNISYGKPNASREEIKQAVSAAQASYFIENLPKKYEQLVGERGIKLSGGQKQRLAIARALIRNPKILILDEATSSLDVESEKLVQKALDKLIQGRTTFIIAHRLSTVQSADKILVLEKGRIVEMGTHKELIKQKGAYYKFYSLQFKI